MHSEHIELLRRMLSSESESDRVKSAYELGSAGSGAVRTMDDLLSRLGDTPRVSDMVVWAVSEIGRPSGRSSEILAAILGTPEARIVLNAMKCVERLGLCSLDIVVALFGLIGRSADERVQIGAALTLRSVLSSDPETRIRCVDFVLMTERGELSWIVLSDLSLTTHVLTEPDRWVRRMVSVLFALTKDIDFLAIDDVMTKSDDNFVRALFINDLKSHKVQLEKFLPGLLSSRSEIIRVEAARLCCEVGVNAEFVKNELILCANDNNIMTSNYSLHALQSIGIQDFLFVVRLAQVAVKIRYMRLYSESLETIIACSDSRSPLPPSLIVVLLKKLFQLADQTNAVLYSDISFRLTMACSIKANELLDSLLAEYSLGHTGFSRQCLVAAIGGSNCETSHILSVLRRIKSMETDPVVLAEISFREDYVENR